MRVLIVALSLVLWTGAAVAQQRVPLNDGTVALIAAAGEQLGVDVSALLAAAR